MIRPSLVIRTPSRANRRRGALCAGALCTVVPGGPASAEPVTLAIVHVNDLDRIDGTDDRGGVARLAAVVKEVRANTRNVLVTHGGDAISPSLLSSFDRGAHMIDLLNLVGVDAMALGNHEFDFTPAVTVARIAEAGFPMLSSNAVESDGTLIDGRHRAPAARRRPLQGRRVRPHDGGDGGDIVARYGDVSPRHRGRGRAGRDAARGRGRSRRRPRPHRRRGGCGADAAGRGRPAAVGS